MCHVLIIEDDWLIGDHVAQLIARVGARSIDMAESEDQAVAHAMARPPGVIISDVHLRSGTGPGAVMRIVAQLGPIPVLFITGEPRQFRPPSADMTVLHKPVDDNTLVATFRSIAALP